MSSDAASEGDKRRALVPKLRFPEFRDAAEWAEKPLASLGQVNPPNAGLPASFTYIDLGAVEAGKLTAANVIGRDGAPSRAQRVLRSGDVLFQMVRPYQRNNLFFDINDGNYVASTGYAQLRSKGPPRFLYQLLHANYFVERVIAKCTGSNYPAINSSDLAAIPIAAPDEAEQQKIADCLSSLDAVLAAEGERLAALREHKKGLLQALFPSEGQTTPRLRFPEFRGAGEWGEKTLAEATDLKAGKSIPAAEISGVREEGSFSCFGGNGLRGYTSTYTHTGKYPLIGRQGALCGNVNLASGSFYATEHAVVAEARNGVSVDWLYHLLVRFDLNRFKTGLAQPGLSVEVINRLPCLVPSEIEEQQRIADCLSWLDELIAVGVQRLAALKVHKAGHCQEFCAGGHRMEWKGPSIWQSTRTFWTSFCLAVTRRICSPRTVCSTS